MEWTGARYADSPTVEASIEIDAPPEAVWTLVADPLVMPEFSGELQAVEWLDAADSPAVGARFRGHNRHPALGEWSTTSHVVECDRPRVFAWAVEDPDNPTATWRFTLEPAGDGTRLTQWVRMGPGRSGLSLAIEQQPDKEEKIVFVRLREFEQGILGNLDAIKRARRGHRLMRAATTVEGSQGASFGETVDFVVEAERLGLDVCFVAEAWGSDAPSTLGFLAARTSRLLLGSGIMQLGVRTPVATAQAAITLSSMSEGRFLLGLGASGPQVIEGLHGVPFARPARRMRETIEIVRRVAAGDKLQYSGAEFDDAAAGQRHPPDAAVDGVDAPAADLHRVDVTGDAAADRRARRRLARHQLRARGRRGRLLRRSGRGAGDGGTRAVGPRRLPGRRARAVRRRAGDA